MVQKNSSEEGDLNSLTECKTTSSYKLKNDFMDTMRRKHIESDIVTEDAFNYSEEKQKKTKLSNVGIHKGD